MSLSVLRPVFRIMAVLLHDFFHRRNTRFAGNAEQFLIKEPEKTMLVICVVEQLTF